MISSNGRAKLSEKGLLTPDNCVVALIAYSEACRSAFRSDVDHHSEVMPISIPN